MSEFRKGQKVRVTFDAVYTETARAGHWVRWVDTRQGEVRDRPTFIPLDAAFEPVEDLQHDDIVRDDRGAILCRSRTGGWWYFADGSHYPDDKAIRPLALLVRDGQVVT